ncbi:MAG: hypothetical protein WBE14_19865, partial [Xanthobacteraceae bacterium]
SCTHAAAMAILGKLDSGFGTERRIALFASAAARLMKTFAIQVELFRRLRNGGQQFVRGYPRLGQLLLGVTAESRPQVSPSEIVLAYSDCSKIFCFISMPSCHYGAPPLGFHSG